MLEIPMTKRQKGRYGILSFALAAIVLSLALAEGCRREREKADQARAETARINAQYEAAAKDHAAAEKELAEARAIKRQQAAKLAEIAARDSAIDPLREILGHGVMRLDADGRVLEWNKTLENWTGWKAEEMYGNTLERVMRPADYEKHSASYPGWLRDSTSEVRSIFLDCDLIHRDPSKPPVSVRVGANKIEQIGDGIPPIAIGLIHLQESIADLTKGDPPPK